MVSNIFHFRPDPWGDDPLWLIFFQMGWNHQLLLSFLGREAVGWLVTSKSDLPPEIVSAVRGGADLSIWIMAYPINTQSYTRNNLPLSNLMAIMLPSQQNKSVELSSSSSPIFFKTQLFLRVVPWWPGFFSDSKSLPEVFQVAAGPRLFSSKQRSIFWCGGLVEPGEPAAEPSLKKWAPTSCK